MRSSMLLFLCLATVTGELEAQQRVAFINDADDYAYCRLQNLTGKRDDNCGAGTLPADGGPWMSTSGENFADVLGLMFDPGHRVFRLLRHDEFGQALASTGFSLTGDDGTGRPGLAIGRPKQRGG